MIEISWSTFFLLYLLFALGLIFSLWIRKHLYQKKRKIELASENIRICQYCQNAWAAKIGVKISRCPVCQSLN